MRLDPKATMLEGGDAWRQLVPFSQPPDLSNQLGAVIRYQPGVDLADWLGAWAAIDHDAAGCCLDQQARWSIPR